MALSQQNSAIYHEAGKSLELSPSKGLVSAHQTCCIFISYLVLSDSRSGARLANSAIAPGEALNWAETAPRQGGRFGCSEVEFLCLNVCFSMHNLHIVIQ